MHWLSWLVKMVRTNFQFLKLMMNLYMRWENSYGGISETEPSMIAN